MTSTNFVHTHYHRGKLHKLTVNTSKKIILTQEPQEIVTLKFDSICIEEDLDWVSDDSQANRSIEHECDLVLSFHNNLHVVAKDYGYEVNFYVYLLGDPDNLIPLFLHRELRTSDVIQLSNKRFHTKLSYLKPEDKFWETFFKEGYDKYHICFSISRFNIHDRNHANNNTLEKSIGSILLETGDYSDVSLIVGEKTLKAHKHILAQKSPVFKAMFSHNMSENQSGSVKIDDLDSDVIEEMLAYIYTGKINCSTSETALELFKAAHKYNIKNLRLKCKEHILFSLNHRNAADALEMVHICEDEDLKKNITTFINLNEKQVVQVKSYQNYLCNSLTIDTVVDTLKLCAKYDLADVKLKALEFVKCNNKELAKKKEFLDLIESHPKFMKEVYAFVHQ